MKPSMWNVLGIGVGGVLSASLLVGCADGRGSNGFKSYQYSKEQMAANKAAMDAKMAKNSNLPVVNQPVNEVPPVVEPSKEAAKDADPNKQVTLAQEAVDSVEYQKAQDSAKGKDMADLGQEPVQVSVQALRVSNDQAVASNKEVPQLKKLVKGVTVTSNMADKQLLLNIDAIVVIDGAEHTLAVQNAPLSYIKEGVTTALPFRLKKGADAVVPGKKLVLTAICKDESCTAIQIRFSFEVAQGKRAGAVVGYKLVDQGVWQLVESNIGEVAELAKAQKTGEANDPLKTAQAAERAKANGQQLTPEQTAALQMKKSVEQAKAAEAERLAREKEAKEAAETKKASEDAATLAAGAAFEGEIEKAAVLQQAAAKKASEDAATLAAGAAFEGELEKAARQQAEAQTPKATPAAGSVVPGAENVDQGAPKNADGTFMGGPF